jgi:hypothetical protein
MTTRPEFGPWARVVPDDDPADLTALTRLQILNTLLIASALHERGDASETEVIRYEAAVLDPAAAHASLARLVPEAHGLGGLHSGFHSTDAADDNTFATTTGKSELTAYLDEAGREEIAAATASALSAGREAVPGPAWDLARDWASGDGLYSLAPSVAKPRQKARPVPADGQGCPVTWVSGHDGGPLWRNLLVSNDEFAAFLNEMASEGLPNCLDGCYLLAVEMPHERGGRLHYNRLTRRWIVSLGYGAHPAYWMTWTGPAAYAARHGARLPSRADMVAEADRNDLAVTNHDYQAGDTVPCPEPGRSPGEIHHLVGNLQVWCYDGPTADCSAPAQRWLHGAAWNTPGTQEEIHRTRARHLTGASRGVGVRLVRDYPRQRAASPAEVAATVNGWVRSLDERDSPLRNIDEALAEALAELQADLRLRPRVRAGAREPGDG